MHIKYQNQLCGIIEEPKIITEEEKEEKLKNLRQKQKEYREKNADKIKEFKKKYNEENKEKIKEQTKKYYEEHKEEIKEQNKENEEKIKEYKDEWYKKNKEKVLQKQKELFACECGSEIRSSGKTEHNRSSKHQQYINSLNINNVSDDF